MLRRSWPPTSTANNKNNNSNGGLQCWWWWLPSSLSLTGHGTALSFSYVTLPLSLSHTHTGTCAVQPALQTGFEGGNWPAWALRWLCWYIPTADALGQRQAERAPVFFLLVDLYLPLVRTVGRSERYLKRNSKNKPVFVFVQFFVFN